MSVNLASIRNLAARGQPRRRLEELYGWQAVHRAMTYADKREARALDPSPAYFVNGIGWTSKRPKGRPMTGLVIG